VQTPLVEQKLVKRVPSAAMRSRFGVLFFVDP